MNIGWMDGWMDIGCYYIDLAQRVLLYIIKINYFKQQQQNQLKKRLLDDLIPSSMYVNFNENNNSLQFQYK